MGLNNKLGNVKWIFHTAEFIFSFLKGLPECLRMKIWLFLVKNNNTYDYRINPSKIQEDKMINQAQQLQRVSGLKTRISNRISYKDLFDLDGEKYMKLALSKPAIKQYEQIQKDIHRSFAGREKYCYTQHILRRNLYALSNWGVQYSQGMNYILLNVIIFCLQSLGLDDENYEKLTPQLEKQMFTIMVGIVSKMQETFGNNNIFKVMKDLQQKIAESEPETLFMIYNFGMDCFSCFSQYYYSVMSYNDPPQDMCKYMMDLFFLQGQKAIHSMVVRMLEIANKEIAQIKILKHFKVSQKKIFFIFAIKLLKRTKLKPPKFKILVCLSTTIFRNFDIYFFSFAVHSYHFNYQKILENSNSQQMFMTKQSSFQRCWETPKSAIQYIKSEVKNHFEDSKRLKQQVFRLKSSVLYAYNVVFKLCTQKPSYKQLVFDKYKQTLKEFLKQLNQKRVLSPRSHGKNALIQFNKMWEQYAIFMLTISKMIFSYLDRYFTPAMDEGNLSKIGMKIFLDEILKETEQKFIFQQFINELGKVRDQRIINHRELLKFTESLMVIDPNNLFIMALDLFINQTKNFYEHFYVQNNSLSPLQYLSSANNLFYFEKFLASHVVSLGHRQLALLIKLFQKNVIQAYTHKLLTDQKGLIFFLDNRKIDALKRVTKIYRQFQGFQRIRKVVYQYTIQKGIKFIQNKTNSIEGINQFFCFYNALKDLIDEGFEKQKETQVSFKNAIEKILSQYQTFVQDLLKYIRQILDKGHFDEQKNKIKTLFELLNSKDDFLALYQSSLQNKILDGSFVYMIEKKFTNELIDMCGTLVTTKIGKKIEDYFASLPVCSKFNEQNNTRIILNSKILSLQLWQKKFNEQIAFKLNIVQPMASLWNKFEQIYVESFQNKKLTILPFQSKLVLEMRFNFMHVIIKCNLLQACIIFFVANYAKEISQEQILSGLMIQKSVFNRFIEQCPPFIKKITQCVYCIDWNYSGKQTSIDLDQKAAQDRKVPKAAFQDRDILIQAAIMKSMKRIKNASFEQITQQILSRIKLFKPIAANIRASLQKLVKKEQLEEDQVNGLFRYLE